MLLENSAFPDVFLLFFHQNVERCFSLHVVFSEKGDCKLGAELQAFQCTIITRWSEIYRHYFYNLNPTFKPEFSYENLVLFVLLNRFFNKEAVRSAGSCFFLDQLFNTVVEEDFIMGHLKEKKKQEKGFTAATFSSIHLVTTCYETS